MSDVTDDSLLARPSASVDSLLARPSASVDSLLARPSASVDSLLARPSASVDPASQTELEAAAFRRLVAHLRERTDVQNIDLMNLAGFCRNCLSKWYRAEAEQRGLSLSDPEAREAIYGMPYDAWKQKFQK